MDYVLIGGVVLFGLIGIWKGGAKIFFGFFMLLVIMVGSAFISAAVCPLFLQKTTDEGVVYTAPAQALMSPIGGALPSSEGFSDLLDTEIVLDESGVPYIGEVREETNLKAVVSANIPVVGPYLASFLETAAAPGVTLRTSVSYVIARSVYEVGVWVILVIILAIIRNIIRKKIFRWLDDKSHSTMSKIDRLIGFAVNVVIFVALVWGFGAVVARFDDGANWATSINTFLLNGSIAGPFMQANPILKLLGITLPAA